MHYAVKLLLVRRLVRDNFVVYKGDTQVVNSVKVEDNGEVRTTSGTSKHYDVSKQIFSNDEHSKPVVCVKEVPTEKVDETVYYTEAGIKTTEKVEEIELANLP